MVFFKTDLNATTNFLRSEHHSELPRLISLTLKSALAKREPEAILKAGQKIALLNHSKSNSVGKSHFGEKG